MNDFAGSADQIAEKLVAGGMEPDRAMMMALRMAQSRQQADESILGGVPAQPPTSDVPPATEILGGDPSKLFQRQPTAMERIRDLPKDVLGAGEALVSMGSLAALAPASMLYALRPGQKTQGDPMEFALRNMYMPRSERGPSHLAGLGEVLESLPQTGPLPELQAFTGVGRGVGKQLAEKGKQIKKTKPNKAGQPSEAKKDGGTVNHKAVASARRALEKAMAKGGEVKMGTGGSMLGTVAGRAAAAAGKKSTQWAQEAAAAKRAPAKSKEEIEAIARRMAAQTQPGFVRASEEQSINPAGKSQLLYEMEQRTPMVVESTIADRPVPNVDYEQQLGKVIVGVPGDPTMGQVAVPGSLESPTRGGKQLVQVGDVRPETPVQLYGGPQYGANLDETFWASNLSPARAVQNLVQEMAQKYGAEQVLGKYIKMSPESSRFAMHNLDALISVLQPEKLDKDKVELLNNLVRKGNPKNKFPEFAGFEDPINVLLQAQMNSKLRKQISEVLEKPSVAKQVGFPFPGKVVQTAITEPELRNVETGVTGFAIGKMNPKGKLSFSSHPTYDYDIPGQAIGRSKYLIPSEMSFPDFTAWYRSRPDVQAKVDPINMMKSYGPRQVIDQQYIDEIKMYEEAMKRLTGKKKGGLMKKSSKLPKVIKSGKVGGLSALRK